MKKHVKQSYKGDRKDFVACNMDADDDDELEAEERTGKLGYICEYSLQSEYHVNPIQKCNKYAHVRLCEYAMCYNNHHQSYHFLTVSPSMAYISRKLIFSPKHTTKSNFYVSHRCIYS